MDKKAKKWLSGEKMKEMAVPFLAALVVGILIGFFVADSGLLGEAFVKKPATSFAASINASSCNADATCEAKSLKVGTQSVLINGDSIVHTSNSEAFLISSNQSIDIDSKGDFSIDGGGVAIASDSSLVLSPTSVLYVKNLKTNKLNQNINQFYLCIDSYNQVYKSTVPCV